MKKISTFLLALIACAGTIFANGIKIGNLYYNLNANNKTAEVTYQEQWSLTNYSYLTAVNIPESVEYNSETYVVTSIGNYAFSHCTGLTSITIPNSVTSIGSEAFAYCSGLTSIEIPNSVTRIGSGVFADCSGLTSIEIPNSVTSIGRAAFSYCTGLTSIEIPNSVTSIGNSAFAGCSGLTSITIPNSVTSIGNYAFQTCSGLTSIVVASGNTKYDSRENCNAIIETYSNTLIAGCQNTIIPNSVTSIANYAFYGCTGLTSITIPNSVTSIGTSAFSSCSGLTSVTIGNSVTSIGDDAFYNVPNIVYNGSATGSPWGARSINGYIDGFLVYGDDTKTNLLACSSQATGTIEIPNSVTSIGIGAFYGCSGLTSITIPNSVTSIGTDAFNNCPNIKHVTWNAKNCNKWNFGSQVETFSFGDEVEIIPENLCSGMEKLTYIAIPKSVTSIGTDAFNNCPNIKHVTWNAKNCNKWNFGSQVETFSFGDEVEIIPANLCFGMEKLTYITIPNSVTSIRYDAFHNCSGLTSVTIGNSVTSIGTAAFNNCPNIKHVTWNAKNCNKWNFGSQVETFSFGDEVEIIPENLCSGMEKLTYIAIPKSVTSIGDYAFKDCKKLEEIVIPANVTYIGKSAFENGNRLETIKLGSGVETIGERAFANCPYILSVYAYMEYPPVLETSVFVNCGDLSLVDLFVPENSITRYKKTDVWKEFNIQAIADEPEPITDYTVNYLDKDGGLISTQIVKLELPEPSVFAGFTFVKWIATSDNINDGINIQAIYEYNGNPASAPEIYTNPSNPAQKLLRNGKVYILTGNKTYTVTGQQLK